MPISKTSPTISEPSTTCPETREMLFRMREEKKIAEDKEDFDLANALKNTIMAVSTLGDQIGVRA